jgi:hypothetical protein
MDWRWGSSSRAPPLKIQSPEPQSHKQTKNPHPISKITVAKRAGGVVQVYSTCPVNTRPSSTPPYTKIKQKTKNFYYCLFF